MTGCIMGYADCEHVGCPAPTVTGSTCRVCHGSGVERYYEQVWSFADTISAEAYEEECSSCGGTGIDPDSWEIWVDAK
jgi:DnaJ-class molecular chaperone